MCVCVCVCVCQLDIRERIEQHEHEFPIHQINMHMHYILDTISVFNGKVRDVMWRVYLRLLQLNVTLLQLHFAPHLVVLQAVHQLRLLQELLVQMFSLRHQLLVSSGVLLQVRQILIPQLLRRRQLSALLLQLMGGRPDARVRSANTAAALTSGSQSFTKYFRGLQPCSCGHAVLFISILLQHTCFCIFKPPWGAWLGASGVFD